MNVWSRLDWRELGEVVYGLLLVAGELAAALTLEFFFWRNHDQAFEGRRAGHFQLQITILLLWRSPEFGFGGSNSRPQELFFRPDWDNLSLKTVCFLLLIKQVHSADLDCFEYRRFFLESVFTVLTGQVVMKWEAVRRFHLISRKSSHLCQSIIQYLHWIAIFSERGFTPDFFRFFALGYYPSVIFVNLLSAG